MNTYPLILALMFLFAHAIWATDTDPQAEISRRIDLFRNYPVLLPQSTDFDADPVAKKKYLELYAMGYRRAMAGIMCTYCPAAGKYLRAETAGFSSGQRQAYKDHRESIDSRIAEMEVLQRRAAQTEQGAPANL